jgi:uncharacterized protein YbaA (DUF1428 family)
MTKANPAPYIDGFVAAVPDAKKAAYLAHCETCASIFIEHGALRVVDTWGNDVPMASRPTSIWR